MKAVHYWGFLLLLLSDTAMQLCFKLTGAEALPVQFSVQWLQRLLQTPWVWGAVLGYVVAFFNWISLLRHAPLGPAFAATHLQVVTVMLASAWLFGEAISWPQLAGAVLIVAGVVCLAIAQLRSDRIDQPGSFSNSPDS